MTYDYLIVGLGWAGMMTANALIDKGFKVLVYDDANLQAAWLNSAAIINPYHKSTSLPLKDFDLYFTAAHTYYNHLSAVLGMNCMEEKSLLLFKDRTLLSLEEMAYYQILPAPMKCFFKSDLVAKKLNPLYSIAIDKMIPALKQKIIDKATLVNATFYDDALLLKEGLWHYHTYKINKVVYTRGAFEQYATMFKDIKFTKNRGDVLWLNIPHLPTANIYDIGMRIVHVKEDLFWMGSNNVWQHDNIFPDEAFKSNAIHLLNTNLKLPYEIIAHTIGWRPTTAGQNIVLKEHPEKRNMYMFNGLGTRGFSKGPYYLNELMKIIM